MRPSVPSQRDTGPSIAEAVVLVDGIDGSGKTSFAGLLADTMRLGGAEVALVHVDDFRRSVAWNHPAGEAAVYWDQYFDLEAAGREVGRAVADGQVVVLEGIFTLRLPAVAGAPLVYLEVDYSIAADRIFRRDTARGRTPEDVRHRIEARYFPAQRRYRAEYLPCDRAAVLIDSTDAASMRLVRGDWARLPGAAAEALRRLLPVESA